MTTEPIPVGKLHEQYQAFLNEGRFMIQYSPSTSQYVFYPRAVAPVSGATDLQWVPASGEATVYATTIMRPRPPAEPFCVCIVELAEGPRMMSRVEGLAPTDVQIGMRVRARVAQSDNGPIVVFDPDELTP